MRGMGADLGRRGKGKSAIGGEHGFALVITLIVTALLVALLVEFVSEVYVDASHSRNFVATQQASILAESGIAGGVKLLQTSAMMRQAEKNPHYSSLLEIWAKPFTYDAGVGTVTITVEEESGKLDLNSAVSQNGTPQDFRPAYQDVVKRLLTNLGLSQDLYEALKDWADTDDTPKPNGAESSYYGTLRPPYQAHNDYLNTVEELAQVKGFTPEVLTKLKSCVTVYGLGPKTNYMSATPININTAPKELLASLDDSLMRGDLVDQILEYRKTHSITSLSEIPGISSKLATSLQGLVGCEGSIYRIHSEGKVGESVAVAEAVVTDVNNAKPTVLYWRQY